MTGRLARLARVAGAAAVAGGLTLAIVGLSQVPWDADASGGGGLLRLAWRYRSALVNECRRLTPDELARMPVHMRQATDCERRLRPYVLTLELDGVVVMRDTARARGARADRPLAVFLERPLAAGRAALRVTFAPVAVPGDSAGVPPVALALDTAVVVRARDVVLVTLDEARGALVVPPR
jgi:hypothetical protein